MENVASVSLVDNDTDGSQRVRVTFVGDSDPLITDFEHSACVKPIAVKPKEPITKSANHVLDQHKSSPLITPPPLPLPRSRPRPSPIN